MEGLDNPPYAAMESYGPHVRSLFPHSPGAGCKTNLRARAPTWIIGEEMGGAGFPAL